MKILSLADVKDCPMAANFYDKFRSRIAGLRTIKQRNDLLDVMQADFEKYVRAFPEERDAISVTYELLKKKCWQQL